MPKFSFRAALAASLLIAPMAAGCASDDPADTDRSAATVVTVSDQWAKAAPDGMTSLFGTFHNSGDHDVRIVSATSPVAGSVELHEVVTDAAGTSVMQEKGDGFHIPAGGSHELTPGGDHLMLIDLTEPLTVGSDIDVEVTFDDGSTLPFVVQVRDFPGADEQYGTDGAHDHGDHGVHDHGDHGDHGDHEAHGHG